jgi:hypothetical protein
MSVFDHEYLIIVGPLVAAFYVVIAKFTYKYLCWWFVDGTLPRYIYALLWPLTAPLGIVIRFLSGEPWDER